MPSVRFRNRSRQRKRAEPDCEPNSTASRRQLCAWARQCNTAEICILAGGLSKRMGCDKSKLRLGATRMLDQIQKTARATGLPVRVIRRDCVPKCGPLGGIYTALKTTEADAVLFLACDMPLVSPELIDFVLQQSRKTKIAHHNAVFVSSRGVGFPILLGKETEQKVQQQIEKRELSLQSLAEVLDPIILRIASPWRRQLFNVNTPRDWAAILKRVKPKHRTAHKTIASACI